jgi:hypothetical protein
MKRLNFSGEQLLNVHTPSAISPRRRPDGERGTSTAFSIKRQSNKPQFLLFFSIEQEDISGVVDIPE